MRRPKYLVRLLSVAEEDLDEILTHIAQENPSAAYSLADTFESNLQALSTHPFLGRIPDDEKLFRMGYRFLIIGEYLVFYTVGKRSVLIHRIIHGAREYRSLL